MADLKQIKTSMETTQNWVANRQAIHLARMTSAVDTLQNNIVNLMAELSVNKGGGLAALRLNSKKLANIHKDVILAFEKDFNGAAKVVTNDFLNAQNNIIAGYKDLDEALSFSGADRQMMNVLRDSSYKEYALVGGQAQEKVIQSMYNNVLAGDTMADLTNQIRNSLTGIKGMGGRPLVNFARLYANDMIMNFHNDVSLSKGLSIGMNRFLYYGTLIAASRDFCKRRVGQAYTKKQIDSWKGSWKGKRGDAWTFRGGWNCRHHWQPVRKKWLDKYDPIEMQSYFAETGQKLPKQVSPWKAPKPVTKVKYKDLAKTNSDDFMYGNQDKIANIFGGDQGPRPDSIRSYTGSGYKHINGHLRSGKTISSMPKRDFDDLMDLDKIVKSSSLPSNMVLRKGYGFDYRKFEEFSENLKPGVIFKDKGFVSATVGPVDDYFMNKDYNIEMKILAKKGSKGKYISAYDLNKMPDEEFEFLLPRSSKFKVNKFIENKNIKNTWNLEVELL